MRTTATLLDFNYLNRSPWVARFSTVADRLLREHGVPTLGNFRDPIKEIFYILLSAKTTDGQYRATHRKLWSTFPKLEQLAAAPVAAIRRCILSGGLAGKRARQIQRTARRLIAAGGRNPASFPRRCERASHRSSSRSVASGVETLSSTGASRESRSRWSFERIAHWHGSVRAYNRRRPHASILRSRRRRLSKRFGRFAMGCERIFRSSRVGPQPIGLRLEPCLMFRYRFRA